MAWRIEFDAHAEPELDRIDPQHARRILAFLHGRLARLEDPRSIGEALKGPKLGAFWKYRGVIGRIEDGAVVILVVRIGNRKDVYRK